MIDLLVPNTQIHAVIISWENQETNAQKIALSIQNLVSTISVVYSHSNDSIQEGVGNWIKTPNSFFYGKKFSKALELHNDGHLLIIHADAEATNWPKLISRCQAAFAIHPQLGVWAPRHTGTPWQWDNVCLGDPYSQELQAVAQTDGIVVAYAEPVIKRLKQLSYERNHYGWGIDWAAVCFSYCNNLSVLMDPALLIDHTLSSQDQYSDDASSQMKEFFEQLTSQEKIMQSLLENHISLKKVGYELRDIALAKKQILEQESLQLHAHIEALHQSNSWRLTRPFRAFTSRLRKLKSYITT